MPSLDSLTPYLTLLIFLAPLLPRLLNLVTSLLTPSPHPRPPAQPLPYTVLALLAVHTVYHLRTILRPPQSDQDDLFQLTGVPLFAASTAELRARLGRMYVGGVLPEVTQALLAKLQSYDARVIYARFGGRTFLDCTWCAAPSSEAGGWDYLAYWAVGAAAGYLAEVVFWGLVTGLSGRENWRRTGLWVMGGLGVAEMGWRWWGEVEMGGTRGEGRMIHSQLSALLPPILLALPLSLPFLSPPPLQLPTPLTTLPALLPTAESLLTHLKLLELSRIASLRHPVLRANVVATAEQIAADGKIGMADQKVKEAGERVGLTAEEGVRGGLREGARGFLAVARQRMEHTVMGMGLAGPREA